MRMIDNNHSHDTREKKKYSYVKIDPRPNQICVEIARDSHYMFVKNEQDINLTCDFIFYDECQQTVCETILKRVKENCFGENNCLILSYGHVGAGKTSLCFKVDGESRHHGLAPRLIDYLLELRTTNQQVAFSVHLTFIEFRGVYITDLFIGKRLESTKKADMVEITSTNELIDWLNIAGRNRRYKNALYGPSHVDSAVLTIFLSNSRPSEQWRQFQIQIADLSVVSVKNEPQYCFEVRQLVHAVNNDYESRNHTALFSPLLLHLRDSLGSKNQINVIAHMTAGYSDLPAVKSFIDTANKLTGKFYIPDNTMNEVKVNQIYIGYETQKMFQKNGFGHVHLQEFRTSIEREGQIKRAILDYLEDRRSEAGTLSVVNVDKMMQVFKAHYQNMKRDINSKGTDCENLEVMMSFQRLARSESTRSKSVRILNSSSNIHDEVKLKNSSLLLREKSKVLNGNPKITSKNDKIEIKALVNSKMRSLERLNFEQQTELTGDNLCDIINNIQKSYLSLLLALQQTKTEVLVLKAKIECEVGECDASPQATMLNNFDDHINNLQNQVDGFEPTITFIQLRETYLNQNLVQYF